MFPSVGTIFVSPFTDQSEKWCRGGIARPGMRARHYMSARAEHACRQPLLPWLHQPLPRTRPTQPPAWQPSGLISQQKSASGSAQTSMD